jgi:hypothetical protein
MGGAGTAGGGTAAAAAGGTAAVGLAGTGGLPGCRACCKYSR